MKSHKTDIIRRSVALPARVVEAALRAAPEELRHNLNRVVMVSLEEFAARRRALAFERAMEEMAEDPAIRTECATISRDFGGAEADGLTHD